MGKKRTILLIVLSLLLIAGVSYCFTGEGQSPVRQALGIESYDVIVVGGEPEGVAAAVAAARNGARTLLIEHRDGLGGLMTYGMLTHLDMGTDKDNKPANRGIFQEWHRMVGAQPSFDVLPAKQAFLRLVRGEPNLKLSLSTTVKKIELTDDGRNIRSITVQGPGGEKTYRAQRFIDSTQDADLAARAGVPYFMGKEDIGLKNRSMCVTLMIFLKNVDWSGLQKTAASGKFGPATFYSNTAWGFWRVNELYKPYCKNTRLRGLNLARQGNGTVSINALQIFGVDPLDEQSKAEAIEVGKEETQHVLAFLRANFPGFEKAEVAFYPPELYVRESRHIRAEYQLPISDVWENRDHWDSIGFGAYPVDLQAETPDGYNLGLVNPIQYAIPFRSLVPLKIDNLLVASRCSGYSSLAAGSARTLPIGMTAGEAAGTAAALSINYHQNFRTMCRNKESIAVLQNTLKRQGAHLYRFKLGFPYQNEWFYPYIKILYSKGLICAGYDNNLHVNEKMPQSTLVNLLRAGLSRTNSRKYNQVVWPAQVTSKPITRDQAAALLMELLEQQRVDESAAWDLVHRRGLIPDVLYKRVRVNRYLSRAEGYVMAGSGLQFCNSL